MSTHSKAIDFAELVRQVTTDENWWDKTRLSIWGGTCEEAVLPDLLTRWSMPNDDMAYVIWEFADRILFRDWKSADAELNKKNVTELERGRIFGARGDLSIRRDRSVFRWNFVGKAGVKPPTGYAADDFFQGEGGARFFRHEEFALLWGERKGEAQRWFEDRVAHAVLEYPIDVKGRVKICYWTFSRAGQVEFVWFRALKSAEEVCDG